MKRQKILTAFKILVILILLGAISLLAFLQWKKDFIMRKVMDGAQAQMVDSLRYTDATLNWLSYFPSIAIQLHNLHVGHGQHPLIRGGDVEIIVRLFPLFQDRLIINRLRVTGSALNIEQHSGKWSYEVFRESADKTEDAQDESLTILIRQIDIEHTRLRYDDGEAVSTTLHIESATIEGTVADQKLDADILLTGSLEQLKLPSYEMPSTLSLNLKGRYLFDRATGVQQLRSWQISNDAISASVQGSLFQEAGFTDVDLDLQWKDGQPEILKQWLPKELQETWKAFMLSGKTDGQATIRGRASRNTSPRILANAKWHYGGIDFVTGDHDLNGLNVGVKYDSGDRIEKQLSSLSVSFKKGGILGRSLDGDFHIHNLSQPVVDASMTGRFPATLLNILNPSGLTVERGEFDIHSLTVRDLSLPGAGMMSFISSADASIDIDDFVFTLWGRPTSLAASTIRIRSNRLQLEASRLTWSEVKATEVKSSLDVNGDQLDYVVTGKMCDGEADIRGHLSGMDTQPVIRGTWIIKSMEMRDLMASFSNFDQSFITSDHLSGQADIWAESVIPFDEKWRIKTREVLVRSAIDIREGRLKQMKTLEDFAGFVHLDDLQDIRFSQLRNYLKIEAGKVYLPVMFIQSSAINLSISGVHGFDQKILYNVKVNAGQAAAHKLKKADVRKELKQARKSGWINMYFVLDGTTSDVRYQQYRTAVISGFEQSSKLKEDLRKYLVDTFGYDVYWLEPNEWEDIPEYK